jgi:superfamily I DNA/RNA helicase
VRVEVHPLLGSVQVFHESNVDAHDTGVLFQGYTDEELARCGVPEGLMTLVRTFANQDALIEHIELLPDEAAEALWALSGGATLEEARASAGLAQNTPEGQTSTELDIAVEHTASRRQLAEVDDEELARMLDAPLALWRTYLHPSQRHAVEMHANGPIRVLGGAGTGKTVALLHRVGFLLREVFTGEERVLVTTFTRNLTLELESALRDLLTDEEFERVDVHNLHSVATRVLREQGLSMELARDDDVDAAWTEALKVLPKDLARRFDRAFFEYEWKHVILAGDIYDSTGYMEARRSRMGTRVHRLTRVRLWPVFEAYREALGRRGVSHWDDLLSQAAYMMKGEGGYAAVLSDEVQDYTPAALRLLRALVPRGPNDMFLVGDAHQRIYGAMANFKACGIHIVGRSVRLKVNYRTTERIRQVAMGALAGCVYDDLDGGDDDLDGYHSIRAGVEPVMWHGESKDDELEFLDELLTRWIVEEDVESSEICIATRLGAGVSHYTRGLEARNFTLEQVTKDVPAHELPLGLRIATFHRLKGTEFSRVVLVGVNAFTFPFIHQDAVFPDEQAREEVLKTERALFYVAATRARDHLVVTGWGDRSEYLNLNADGQLTDDRVHQVPDRRGRDNLSEEPEG